MARGPLFAGQVDRVLLDVVLDLEVGLAALAAEDVGGFAGIQLGLEHVEVLVGRDDLVIDVDAGLGLELLGQLELGVLDPALAGHVGEGDVLLGGWGGGRFGAAGAAVGSGALVGSAAAGAAVGAGAAGCAPAQPAIRIAASRSTQMTYGDFFMGLASWMGFRILG